MRREAALDVPDETGRWGRRPSRSVDLVLKLPIEGCVCGPYLPLCFGSFLLFFCLFFLTKQRG